MWNQRRNSAVARSPASQCSRNIRLTGCSGSGRQTRMSCLMVLASVLPCGPANWAPKPGLGGAPATIVSVPGRERSEEHTSELQSLMRISYAVFCLKKKANKHPAHAVTMHKTLDNNYETTNTN